MSGTKPIKCSILGVLALIAVTTASVSTAGLLDDLKRAGQQGVREAGESIVQPQADKPSQPSSSSASATASPASVQGKSRNLAVTDGREPMVKPYPSWLAARFLPQLLTPKMIHDAVVQEIENAKRYYIEHDNYRSQYGDYAAKPESQHSRYLDQRFGAWKNRLDSRAEPFFSRQEVQGRNARMAAPEFIARYKQEIRDFLAGMPTKVDIVFRIGLPKYDRRRGKMFFSYTDKPAQTMLVDYRDNYQQYRPYLDYATLKRQVGGKADAMAEQIGNRRFALGVYNINTETLRGNLPVEQVRYGEHKHIPLLLQQFAIAETSSIAYDRELVVDGISMSPREAEAFLNQYAPANRSPSAFYSRVSLTIKGAVPYAGSALLFGDVEEVAIISPLVTARDGLGRIVVGQDGRKQNIEPRVIARYQARDLPPAKDTLLAQRARLESANRQAENEKSRRDQQYRREVAALRASCEQSASYKCYVELCKKLRDANDMDGYKACRQEQFRLLKEQKRSSELAFQSKMNADRDTQYDKATLQASCRRKYRGAHVQAWMPVDGTEAYKNAMAHCMTQPVQDVRGPDILGVRLGMPVLDARKHLGRQSFTHSSLNKDTRPFEDAALSWSQDANHGVATFFINNGGSERVAAVSRRLFLGSKRTTWKRLADGLRAKYGQEAWSHGEHAMLWIAPPPGSKASGAMCSGLVDMIEPFGGWVRPWDSSRSAYAGGNGDQRRSRRQAEREAKMSCIAEHGMPGVGGSASMDQMMALQKCIQERVMRATASPSSAPSNGGSQAKRPYMIKAGAAPADYAKYQACGAVLIARFNSSGDGSVEDMSLVLFDPGWIGQQPAFAFKSGKSGSDIQF